MRKQMVRLAMIAMLGAAGLAIGAAGCDNSPGGSDNLLTNPELANAPEKNLLTVHSADEAEVVGEVSDTSVSEDRRWAPRDSTFDPNNPPKTTWFHRENTADKTKYEYGNHITTGADKSLYKIWSHVFTTEYMWGYIKHITTGPDKSLYEATIPSASSKEVTSETTTK